MMTAWPARMQRHKQQVHTAGLVANHAWPSWDSGACIVVSENVLQQVCLNSALGGIKLTHTATCRAVLCCAAAMPAEEVSRLPTPGEVEFIMGGPPCQGYSGMNR